LTPTANKQAATANTLPSSADFKLHIGYIRDSRNINLLHRPLLKEDLDIEKKQEEE
jgi:hypothetical protein